MYEAIYLAVERSAVDKLQHEQMQNGEQSSDCGSGSEVFSMCVISVFLLLHLSTDATMS